MAIEGKSIKELTVPSPSAYSREQAFGDLWANLESWLENPSQPTWLTPTPQPEDYEAAIETCIALQKTGKLDHATCDFLVGMLYAAMISDQIRRSIDNNENESLRSRRLFGASVREEL